MLIGGLYPNQKPEWDYGLHGKTLELAVPITQANALLKRVRELLDQSKADGKAVTATYRSGINIKVRLLLMSGGSMAVTEIVDSLGSRLIACLGRRTRGRPMEMMRTGRRYSVSAWVKLCGSMTSCRAR